MRPWVKRVLLAFALVLISCSDEPTVPVVPDTVPATESPVATESQALEPVPSEEAVVGPVTIERSAGAPQELTIPFDIDPFEAYRVFYLVVEPADGLSNPTAAWIELDGEQIVGPDAFNAEKTPQIRIGIPLEVTGRLDVRIAGAPGSGMQVSVVGEFRSGFGRVGPEGGWLISQDGQARLDVDPGLGSPSVISFLPVEPFDAAGLDVLSSTYEVAIIDEAASGETAGSGVDSSAPNQGTFVTNAEATISLPTPPDLDVDPDVIGIEVPDLFGPASLYQVTYAPTADTSPGAPRGRVTGRFILSESFVPIRVQAIPGVPEDCPEDGYFRLIRDGDFNPDAVPIVFIHGWQIFQPDCRSWQDFNPLETFSGLAEDVKAEDLVSDTDYQVYHYTYPTYRSVPESADRLAQALDTYLGNRKAIIVAHSMGGLVARFAAELHATNGQNIRDIVTLGTPHEGSFLALLPVRLTDPDNRGLLFGRCGIFTSPAPAFCRFLLRTGGSYFRTEGARDLRPETSGNAVDLLGSSTNLFPRQAFLAGSEDDFDCPGRECKEAGFSLLLEGPDDGIVTVSSAHAGNTVDGGAALREMDAGVGVIHTDLPEDSAVRRWVLSRIRESASAPVLLGLVARYRLDGNALNSAGPAPDGQVAGASPVAGRFGDPDGALRFDGFDDFIRVPEFPELPIGNEPFTVSLWAQLEDYTGHEAYPFYKWGSKRRPDVDRWNLLRTSIQGFRDPWPKGLVHSFYGNVYTEDTRVAVDLPNHEWFHLAVTYDGRTVRVYFNGEMISEHLDDANVKLGELFIGSSQDQLGSIFYRGSLDDFQIYDRELSADEIATLCDVEAPCASESLSGPERIAFTSDRTGNREIYVTDGDGRPVIRLTNSPAADRQPAISPDGRTVVFSSDRSGEWELYTVPTDGSQPASRLTDDLPTEPEATRWNDWHPSGSHIITSFKREGTAIFRLWKVALDGSVGSAVVPATVGGQAYDAHQASYNQAGTELVMTRNIPFNGFTSEVWHSEDDGSGMTKLATSTSSGRSDGGTFVIEDGVERILASQSSSAGGPRDIFIVNKDGTGQRTVYSPPGSGKAAAPKGPRGPGFAEYADSFIFLSDEGGEFDIWRMNLDGSGKRQVTEGGAMSELYWWVGS